MIERRNRSRNIKASRRLAFSCDISWNPCRTGNSGVYYYLKGRLGNDYVIASTNEQLMQYNFYYPYGLTSTNESAHLDKQPYKFGGKEYETMHGLNLYDFEARPYDPILGRFLTPDPLAEKCPWINPYAYCKNNPVKYVDPTGESVHLNRIGDVMAEYDDGDDGVYTHHDLSDWDNKSTLAKSGEGISNIGNLGETIDMNSIFENRMIFLKESAKDMNIVDFGLAVKAGSEWDLKANTSTIWGVAWKFDGESKHKTMFTFREYSMTAADVGNFHYGIAGKYTYQGAGMPDIVLETGAGAAEIGKNVRENNYSEAAKGYVQLRTLTRPYGDRQIDNDWIRAGIRYANKMKNKR
jgi:RHS repeat-associated protein